MCNTRACVDVMLLARHPLRRLHLLLLPMLLMLVAQVVAESAGVGSRDGSNSKGTTQANGVRVGKLGQGFVI